MIFNVNSGAGKIPVNVVPSTNSSFTYDGAEKTPVWQNYDSEQLTISGDTSKTNAGTYTVYFTPKADYEWWDGTSTPKEVTWSIAKAEGSLSLSEISATLTGKNSDATTFTVTYAGDGEISVQSSDTTIATASLSGTTVTVTPKGYGTATITVSVAEGTNYTAPADQTYAFTVNYNYLYNAGVNTGTGGWSNSGVSVPSGSSSSLKNGSVQSDHLYLGYPNGSTYASSVYCSLFTVNKVSIKSAMKTLCVDYTQVAKDGTSFVVGVARTKTINDYVAQGSCTAAVGAREILNIDISTVSGSYYLGIAAYFATGTKRCVKIHRIWLE